MAKKLDTIDIPLIDDTPEVKSSELATMQTHPQVAPVLNKANQWLEFAKNLEVTNRQSAEQAVELLSACKRATNAMESARKFFVKPIKDHAKLIDNWFKGQLQPVEEADAIGRRKLSEYQAEQDRIAQQVAERQRKDEEEAYRKQLAEAKKNKVEPPPAPEPVEEIMPFRTATFSTHGMAKQRSLGWTYELVDMSKLGSEWKKEVPNDELIKEAIDAGVRDIPGLKIYERTTLVVH